MSIRIKADAEHLVNGFIEFMPFTDGKLTSCNEKPELIKEMELLTARQCALLCAKRCRGEILNFDDNGKLYWNAIISEIEKMME